MTTTFLPETLEQLLLDPLDDSVPWLTCPHDPIRHASAEEFSIREIARRSAACAAALQKLDAPGAPVVLVCENDVSFVTGFFGVLKAGMTPVPLPTPHFVQESAEYAARLVAVLRDSGAAAVLTSRALTRVLPSGLPRVIVVEDCISSTGDTRGALGARPSDTALIQYTSGSTGLPRGAELSHSAILSNVFGIGKALRVSASDVGVSWLPLFHDMGLIGTMLFTLAHRIRYVLLRPRTFLFRPASWLWAIARFRGTLSPAPNFAYRHCASKVSRAQVEGLDLSSWRVALNGSEPVAPDTIHIFVERFGASGFQGAVLPVYGLAENSLAVTFAPLDAPLRFDVVDRGELEEHGRVRAPSDGAPVRRLISVGVPLEGQRVRIADTSDQPLEDRCVGEVQVAGPCVMKGYRGARSETAMSITADGWLRTGDRGYAADGQLFLVGREKELIKKNGVSLNPTEIQSAVARLEGVRDGRVAAFGVDDPEAATERLIVAAETTLDSVQSRSDLELEIMRTVAQACTFRPDHVLLVPVGSLPRTTSGKIRNRECRQRFLEGRLARSVVCTRD